MPQEFTMLSRHHRSCRAFVSLFVSFTLLSACTTVETQSFRVTGNSNVDSAYIATDADFSQYNRLLVDEMGIFFPDNASLSANDLARIRQIFRESFINELAGYDITQEPGPGMLKISASLVDLRAASSSDVPNMRAGMQDIAKPGALLFLMEMKDSGTDKVLARAGDSESSPTFAAGGTSETDWESVEVAARRWAALFRTFLDQNLGR